MRAADASFAWPQFGFDEQHSGVNPLESAITAVNVRSLKRLFRVPLASGTAASAADGAPAYLDGVTVNGASKDLIFLTTKDGWILALDAHTGQQIWGKQYGPNGCAIAAGENAGQPCYTTSSPVIDPSRQYVYSYGLDGYVHKYQVATGAETHDAHWPELASLKPADEKGSSALSLATDKSGMSYLYMPGSGYLGDEGDYQGHLTAINLATGAQHVFNTLCSDASAGTNVDDVHFALAPAVPDCGETRAAVWARPGVIHDPTSDLIYIATGNGTFDPTNHYWGDSVLALNPDGTGVKGNPLDSYTPADQAVLNSTDADLGSSAPAILLPIPGSRYPHLAVQGQKINRTTSAAELRLINLDNLSLSGIRGPGHTGGDVGGRFSLPQGGFLLTQPAVWVNPSDPGKPWVFVANDNGIVGLRVYCDSGSTTPTFHLGWKPIRNGGTSPIVANGVLYYFGANGIQALRATDGMHLWSDSSYSGFHWESPIVANGTLYVTDESGNLTAYSVDASATPVITFRAHRQGTRITFRWTVTHSAGVEGFFVYGGTVTVNQALIRAHKSQTYRYVAHWPAKKKVPKFWLRTVMNDGRQFSIQAM
jgi:outer membrane protein assembly factor BamB